MIGSMVALTETMTQMLLKLQAQQRQEREKISNNIKITKNST